jgi:hypothetical protein
MIKRKSGLILWILLAIVGSVGAIREMIWQGRNAAAIGIESRIRQVYTSSSDAEEEIALGELLDWIRSHGLTLSLRADDRRTGMMIPMAKVIRDGDANTIFQLGIDIGGGRNPDHNYQLVLRKPANVRALMRR